jgi:hypothetical protein
MFSRKSISETAATLLIFLFIYTGITKYIGHDIFLGSLKSSPILEDFAGFVSFVLPGFEIVLAVLLILPRTRRIGFYTSAVLLTIFTGYLVYIITTAPKLPCSCGGVISALSWKSHVFFNLFFIVLSLIGIRYSKDRPEEGHRSEFMAMS